MRKILLCLFAALPLFVLAESKEDRAQMHHELRLGWGDQLFETLMWHDPLSVVTSLGEDYLADYNEKYRYMQHWSLEYQYRFNHWFGFGVLADISGVTWDVVTRNGKGVEVSRDPSRHNFYNLVVMPTARFTYFHHPYVNLYSGLGFGLCVNGGTETDAQGNHTLVSGAFDATLLGVSANYKRFFTTFEFGGLTALRNSNTIFMFKSRMFSVSVGARF